MTPWVGHDRARAALDGAVRSGALHHAWLLTGPAGIGKATFARNAAMRMLAHARSPAWPPDAAVPEGDPTRTLIEAGAHPDFRVLERLPRDANKPEQGLARGITVDQVRALGPILAKTPSLSARRVIVVDTVDELERSAANALLKSLEEPPAGTIFLLVSHAAGRLLPTIRSRCRLLRFDPLDDRQMADALRAALPEGDAREIGALVAAGEGSPGRALGYAGLGLAAIDEALAAIAGEGDATNERRSRLARDLSGKSAQARYDAFLDRAPAVIATAARGLCDDALRVALDAHDAARALATSARALSLDARGTVFEMAGLVARLAGRRPGP